MRIETSIVKALQSLGMPSNITIVLSDRDGVEPCAPYLLINIIDTMNVGMPYKSHTHSATETKENIFQVKDVHVSLTFHADAKDSVHEWVQSFHSGLYSDYVDYAFSQQGLGLVTSNGIMYQPQPVSGKAYKRAIIDLTLRSEFQDSFNVNSLNRVDIEGSLKDNLDRFAADVIVDVENTI